MEEFFILGLPNGAYDSSRVWIPEIVESFVRFLPTNDIPCSLRLVNKATAAQFRGRPEYTTVRLSQPVPHHAFTRCWGAPGATRSLTLPQRHRLLCLTAASGSIPNLAVAVAAAGGLPVAQHVGVLASAARAGKLHVCSWLLQQGCSVGLSPATAAAKAGRQEVCNFLLANGVSWHWSIVYSAACGGHPALVDWLLLRRPEGPLGPDDSLQELGGSRLRFLLMRAAEGYTLPALQALHRRGFGPEDGALQQPLRRHWYEDMLEGAARSPTADWRAKVEWLESLEPLGNDRPLAVCSAAAGCPDALCRLKWLRQRGYPLSFDAAWAMARAGDVAGLEFVLAESVEPDADLVTLAAQAGQLEVLKLLRARKCPLEPAAVVPDAAIGGHLPLLVWAEAELGAVVSEVPGLTERAAAKGSVELLAWLHERGCGWDSGTFAAAVESGCEEALEWLAERGCPMGDDGDPYLAAARKVDLLMLRCLRRLGCPWGPVGRVFTECVEWCVEWNRPLPMLHWLIDAGCPIDWEAAVLAAARKSGDDDGSKVPLWLEEQRRMRTEQRS